MLWRGDIPNDDLRALCRQLPRHGIPQVAAAAGYDCGFATQHVVPSILFAHSREMADDCAFSVVDCGQVVLTMPPSQDRTLRLASEQQQIREECYSQQW